MRAANTHISCGVKRGSKLQIQISQCLLLLLLLTVQAESLKRDYINREDYSSIQVGA
jgi:hypothetical protein